MMPKTVFVIGVNGVGKSTVLPYLRRLLPVEKFNVHDFDERGVPDNADKVWRMSETDYFIRLGEANVSHGISTVICGFVKPLEIVGRAEYILLDADEKSIRERLSSRYRTAESVDELRRTTGKTVEKFIADNIYIATSFRKDCHDTGCMILDTSSLAPESVALAIVDILE
jgi:broad-specificity NMP kinase